MSGERFLERWARRKAEARRPEAEPAPEPPAVPEAAEAEEEPLVLPDIATMDAGSDWRPFMQPRVPPELRREALRKLWRLNPLISTPDGLDDYYVTGDFTDKATVVAGLRTLYQVGRGMAAAVEEAAELVERADRAVACREAGPALEAEADQGAEDPALGPPERVT